MSNPEIIQILATQAVICSFQADDEIGAFFCDGNMMIKLDSGFPEFGSGFTSGNATSGFSKKHKSFFVNTSRIGRDDRCTLLAGSIRGAISQGYYREYRSAESNTIYINEKYSRLARGMEFRLANYVNGSCVLGYAKNGKLEFICMSISPSWTPLEELPILESIPDDVLYHVCKCEDSQCSLETA